MHQELKTWGWTPSDGVIKFLKIDWDNNRPRPASHFVGERFKTWEEAEKFARQRGLTQQNVVWSISYVVWETENEEKRWEAEMKRRNQLPLGWGEFYFSFTGTYIVPKETKALKKTETILKGVVESGGGIVRHMYATNHPKIGWLVVWCSRADWEEKHYVYLPPDGRPQALRNGGSSY
ncbi:MAG: hypothetical protein AAB604_02085 [Patescibacteria group bacterium]